MRPGSVIVDLAAENGGNCALTVPGKIVEKNGLTIVGLTNLPSEMAFHASQLYSRNVASLLGLLVQDGELKLISKTRSSKAPALLGRRRNRER